MKLLIGDMVIAGVAGAFREGHLDVTSDDGKVDVKLIVQGDNVIIVAKAGRMVVDSNRACPTVHIEKV